MVGGRGVGISGVPLEHPVKGTVNPMVVESDASLRVVSNRQLERQIIAGRMVGGICVNMKDVKGSNRVVVDASSMAGPTDASLKAARRVGRTVGFATCTDPVLFVTTQGVLPKQLARLVCVYATEAGSDVRLSGARVPMREAGNVPAMAGGNAALLTGAKKPVQAGKCFAAGMAVDENAKLPIVQS
mmetsp:Transcript_5866/g.9114  ORF Transcript_5866/g.9114 Transcript_5866/m.9114 type:complete len:186 (+) Transcript_5866:637-1194(+)